MSTTIAAIDGSQLSTTPTQVDGFMSTADPENTITRLIGGGIAVTLVGGELQEGTLRLVYSSAASAEAARAMFRRPSKFTLTSTDRPEVGMTFVRSGALGRALDDVTRSIWVLEVGFQEVES